MSAPDFSVTDPLNGLRWLQACLEARHAAGEGRLWLTPDARTALREIVKMKPGRMNWQVPAPVAAAPVPIVAPLAEPASVPAAAPVAAILEAAPAAGAPAPPESAPVPLATPPADAPLLSLAEREVRLAEVRLEAAKGEKARALGTLRDKMVFARGNPEARLMLVGEAPGADEEREGEPFVGPAGQKLDQILKAMGFERGDVYVSNICKYRPAMENQRSGNRKPTAAEMATCVEFVKEEIRIISPDVIVALGATAAEGLLGLTDGVGRLRARLHTGAGAPVIVTYHPSWLLRQEDGPEAMASKRLVWEDMLLAMDTLGLAVTKKQRGYFLTK